MNTLQEHIFEHLKKEYPDLSEASLKENIEAAVESCEGKE